MLHNVAVLLTLDANDATAVAWYLLLVERNTVEAYSPFHTSLVLQNALAEVTGPSHHSLRRGKGLAQALPEAPT